MSICLRFCDYFSTFISVNQRFKHDRTATYNRLKRELLSRETYSRNPINYSEGMADDQKTGTYNTLLSRIRTSG